MKRMQGESKPGKCGILSLERAAEGRGLARRAAEGGGLGMGGLEGEAVGWMVGAEVVWAS